MSEITLLYRCRRCKKRFKVTIKSRWDIIEISSVMNYEEKHRWHMKCYGDYKGIADLIGVKEKPQ